MEKCAPYHSPTHAQDIHEIENLSFCPALEKLFLVENLIRKLKGLDRLVNLKELHLHSNRIARIEGLKKLQKLEVGPWGPDWMPEWEHRRCLERRNDVASGREMRGNTALSLSLSLSLSHWGLVLYVGPGSS